MSVRGFMSKVGRKLAFEHMSGIFVMPYAHIHTLWELYFCPEGNNQIAVINGESYTFKHPCAIIVSPYSVHSMSCLEEGGTSYDRFVNYFESSVLDNLGKQLLPDGMAQAHQGILFELTEAQARYLLRFIDFSRDETYPHTSAERELLLGFFLNKLFDFCDESKITRVGTTSFYIQDVLRYIAENIASPDDADTIARRFAVSRSKLDRDFKTGVGMTVHDFSELCRLNYAKSLLAAKDALTVSEISEACGFKNETYFFVFFKKHTGISPTEYRRERLSSADRSIEENDFNPCG